MLWLAVALAPATAVTVAVTGAHKAHQRSLAEEWRAAGEEALGAGDAQHAVEAFRTSLTFAREDRQTRLRLAEALAAAGRDVEARAYLLTLWQDQPGNGRVNLHLARLAARAGDLDSALRHYHAAVEGAWSADAEHQRRTIRLELIDWLVASGHVLQAQAELSTLAGDVPDDPAVQKRVAGLMMRADMTRRALAMYQDVLRQSPRDTEAAAGAGRAAFALANDVLAERYLAQAVRAEGADPELREALTVVRLARTSDPFARRLSGRERTARVKRAIEASSARLESCPASPDADAFRTELGELPPSLARARVVPLETLEAAMDLVFRIQRFAADRCGALTPYDRALLRIADLHEEPPA